MNRFLRDFHNGIAIAFGFDSYYTDFKKSTFLYNKILSKFEVPLRQKLLTVLTLPTLLKTQCKCKIEFTYASHCVGKNLTPSRMLKKYFLIAQIVRWNNSFQNMYDMLWAKGTVWPGKLILSKKTPKNA